MDRYIDLKKLSLDELAGVINLYPWFGSARKELCARMAAIGGNDWGEEQFSDAAMYLPYRRMVADVMRASSKADCSDKDVDSVIKMYIAANPGGDAAVAESSHEQPESQVQRQVRVIGGDYFSQKDYDAVRSESDGVFSRFAAKAKQEMSPAELREHENMDFCTETLAQIYQEQGYYGHARRIYEKLILAYPEKNAYFAALIEKLKTED